jgi:outer membrane protein OmpA-like peptidoglycan-associated protein
MISRGVLSKSITKVEGLGECEEYIQLYKNRMVSISSLTQDSLPQLTKNVEEVIMEKELKIETQSLSNEIDGLEVGETVAIEGLNFIPGRHILLKNSESKLYELLDLLQAYPALKIEIQGHICCSRDGMDGYDLDTDSKMLSLNRAINIYEYLISQGINSNRLSYKGFGPTKPLVKEIDELTRQMNRRVELMIVEK